MYRRVSDSVKTKAKERGRDKLMAEGARAMAKEDLEWAESALPTAPETYPQD